MFLTRQQDLTYACFSNLAACTGVFHGIFTRCGHRLPDLPADANFTLGIHDSSQKQTAMANRSRAARCMGASGLIFLSQVHGAAVSVIGSHPEFTSAMAKPPEADAVISGVAGAGLAVQTADCQAVFLHDPIRHVAANVHSGWRGSIANIIGQCINTMKQRFGTHPGDLIAGIGPSLGPCCAEFIHYETEIPKRFWKYKDDRNRFDFWQISMDQLRSAGVRGSQIELSHICTRCNPHLFFSYRRDKTTGRMAAVIGLKQTENETPDE